MTFLNPTLLYIGLGCIAVPIIVHLLTRRRRKPVQWAAMRFLIEAYKKHRRRLTLEQLLLLAARCALVALIGVALGKPVLGAAGLLGSSGPRTLYLLVDNSLTATAAGDDGKSALDRHKAAGAKLLAGLDQSRGDRAGLIALGGPAEALVAPPSNDISGVGRALDALGATDSRVDLPGALSRLRANVESMQDQERTDLGRITVALLSDWRSGSADVDRALPALPVGSSRQRPLVAATPPAENEADNVAIVRAEPLRNMLLSGDSSDEKAASSAGESNQVRVTLRRFGPSVRSAGVTQVSVRIDRADASAAPGPSVSAPVRWTPGLEEATVPVGVELPEGAQGGLLTLVAEIDRDSIAGDNVYRRPIESRPTIQVGLVSAPGTGVASTIDRFRGPDWLRLALRPEGVDARSLGGVRIVDVDPRTAGQPGVLSGLDAVLLPSPELLDAPAWARIGDFCRAGGLVVVFPAAELTVHLWTDAFIGSLGLDWTIAREARTYTPPMELLDQIASPGPDLFAMLSGELPELVKPIRVSRALPVETGGRGAEVLLRLKDSTPLLLSSAPGAEPLPGAPANKGGAGRGLVVFMAAPPDLRWTDLPTKPLMLPLFQEIVRQGVGRARGVWTAPAGTLPPLPPGAAELRPVPGTVASGGTEETVSLSSNGPAPVLRRAGLWRVTDARGATLGLAAVNADTAASRTAPRSTTELTPWLSSLAGEDRLTWARDLAQPTGGAGAQAVLGDDPRPPISPVLLVCAAAIALLELAMARWFSHASIDRAVQPPLSGGRA
jgi:hypothetical protein